MAPDSKLFALLYRPGPRWVAGEPIGRQPLAEHRAYMEELIWQGRILAAGPFLDATSGGLAVVRAPDAEAAAAVLAEDPAVRDGVMIGEVRPWLRLDGDVTMRRGAADVAAVRRIFAAVESRGDGAGWDARWAAYQQAYAANAVIHEAPSLPYGGDYAGTEGVARHAQGYNAAWSDVQDAAERALEPVFLTGGDRVAVLWRQRAHDPGTGERFDMPAVSVFALRDGRVVDLRMFHFDAGAAADFLRRAHATGGAP